MNGINERLAAIVAAFAAEPFAVLDGAQVASLPEMLSRQGLSARPLLRSPADTGVERAGPWLVALGTTGLRSVLALVGDQPAAVFWAWPNGEAALHGHLRRLNMARLPSWAATGQPEPEGGGVGTRNVLFRHWDPRVLGAVMPALRADQFRRVLGPATEIAYAAPEFGGVRRVVSDPEWPLAPAGPLLITSDQAGAIAERRGDARQARMVAFMRASVGEPLAGVPEADIHEHLRESEAAADRLGIRTEAGHCRWAFLMYATNGEVARHADVADFVRAGKPDAQVEALMGEAARSLRSGRGTP